MSEQFDTTKLLFVLLALLISILSSYTMFQLIGNLRAWRGPRRRVWLFGAAAVFGLGVTVGHFLIMIAAEAMITIDGSICLLLLIATLLAYASFRVLAGGLHPALRLAAASLLLAAALCGLFYTSILSGPIRQFELHHEYMGITMLVTWAGVFASYAAFNIARGYSILAGTIMLGVTTIAMQLLGIDAVQVEYAAIMTADRLRETLTQLMLLLGIGTLLVTGFCLVTWLTNKRLEQVGEQYRLLVENSIDMIAIICEGQWRYVNRSGLRLFEADAPEDLIGKSIYGYLHPKHHRAARARLKSLEPEAAHAPSEQEWYTVKGKPLYTEVVETLTTLAGKPAVQVIIRDISERKKNEELLINSEKLYVAGQLAAGIAHEIRNPLTSLKGFLQLIVSGRSANKNYYDIMKSELVRIESIVSELLMLSKPQVYELAYKDVRQIMGDTITLLEAQATLHDIELSASYDPEPLWIYGVENQVKQVFINVLKNAIEVMSEGGRITIACIRKEEEVVVRISDQGPGIAEEQLAKMGQPFYTTKDKGTGLGLMVSYKIVDNHHGRIRAHSELGTGTTMEIALPYARRQTSGEAADNVTSIHRFRPEGGGTPQ
ncbi:PAS domain S-box protein [Paenibacillus sp. IB182496]|uniref:histidine kinase n=1 Tax=Paenibacillus sabuli TaxID=2772509 RepID=A0A927GUC3_9BACL|nr:ATP-binding protein [Paenibacillus sabuli]MBD2848206.1 PAS domain S-box protein [Paenibacillus sabuli]